ncbi:Transcriptional activator MetR [Labilithrix luteola]|uniref:Transcriptional activator MetR n=1 Tax=Labilithrix luteola TaxID=1391654 RepID=A0A0K1PMM8_9BACT|nr:LysR substrate-binding domain-containing protein [Labilithrix luteola]AKU94778.1 Transcriptional activator MetR [Labilithrix luteola]
MSNAMLEVRHLRLVRAIAEEGGATRAASRLHLTQSAVSHQLAELEGRLGVALFTRVRRQLVLTAAGERLVEAARTMLGDLARLERELHRAGTRKREVLRLVVECFTSYHWLPPIVARIADEHPHVEVRIVTEATREPVAALLRGQIELALVSSPVRDRELVSTPLFEDEWTVIMAPSHRLASRPHVTAKELGAETLFAHDAPRSDVERLRELIAAERATMPRVVLVPLTDALVELVAAGLGVAIVSRWAIAPWERRGEIVTRRFTREGLAERWSAVYRRDAEPRLPLARLTELLADATFAAPSRRKVSGGRR